MAGYANTDILRQTLFKIQDKMAFNLLSFYGYCTKGTRVMFNNVIE